MLLAIADLVFSLFLKGSPSCISIVNKVSIGEGKKSTPILIEEYMITTQSVGLACSRVDGLGLLWHVQK